MSKPHTPEAQTSLRLMSEVVSAYVAKNSVPSADLAGLISTVHEALVRLAAGDSDAPAAETIDKPTPAQIRKSITPDALISFMDGKPYKTLKRHLTKHGLDLPGYRSRFGLPDNYPSVSPDYSTRRSALARQLGLGRKAQSKPTPAPKASKRSARKTPK